MTRRPPSRPTPRRVGAPALLLAAIVPALPSPSPAAAQIPDEFTNLRVLPEDIARDSLVQIMRSFSLELGVRCEHCHVLGEDGSFRGARFDADEKPAKEKARVMLRMVETLNRELLTEVPEREGVEVGCQTCHRKRPVPRLLGAELRAALADGGPEAAVARWEELRAATYGRGMFDFGSQELNTITGGLAAEGRLDAAVALQELNRRQHPDDAQVVFTLGGYHEAAGDLDAAREAYRRVLELNPQAAPARARLEALGGGG